MKNAIRILSALAAAAVMATSASALCPGASPLLLKRAEPIPVIAKGMTVLPVTSSVSDSGEDTAVLFDNDTSTGIDAVSDEDGTVSFTIRAAAGIPQTLSAVALVVSSPDEATVSCRIWGTNDSTEAEWTPLALHYPVIKTGEWRVLNLAEPEDGWSAAEKYAFYKIEITAEETEHHLAILVLFLIIHHFFE